jgi:hypothetical protein
MSFFKHLIKVGQVSKQRINVAVVTDVIAGIFLGRAVKGAQPNSVNPKLFELGKAPCDAFEITHPIAIMVGERAWVDLVDDA